MSDRLPPNGPLTINSWELGAGHRIGAATDWAHRGDPQVEVMWMTDRRLEDPGAYWWLLQHHPDLQPVLLDGLGRGEERGERRPWDSELVVWDTEVAAVESVPLTLSALWSEDDEDPTVQTWKLPYREFPGLASVETEALSDIELELVTGASTAAWLGLVPTRRAADVPLRVGWFACSDAFGGSFSPAALTAVLRSWEERFGATVFRLGWASLDLLVTRPPRSESDALAVAAEFFGVASEFRTPQGAVVQSVREMAECILGSPWWRFWWD